MVRKLAAEKASNEEAAEESTSEVEEPETEEVATGTEWWKCEEGDESPGGDAACKEEEFGTGGGPGILPQDGQVLCKRLFR